MSDQELQARADAAASEHWYNADFLGCFIDADEEQSFPDEDAAFIAAASPERISRLLAEKAALVEALRDIASMGGDRPPAMDPATFCERQFFNAVGRAAKSLRATLEGVSQNG